jgi:hypothetical protein
LRIARIASDHALILPHRTNPCGYDFREQQVARRNIGLIQRRVRLLAARLALLAAASMTREAALLPFNSVYVTVSTISRISFMCAQARIELE